jgi:hypothetical protein
MKKWFLLAVFVLVLFVYVGSSLAQEKIVMTEGIDSSSPPERIVAAGTKDVLFTNMRYTATGGIVRIRSLSIGSENAKAETDLSNIRIYYNGILLNRADSLEYGDYSSDLVWTPLSFDDNLINIGEDPVIISLYADINDGAEGFFNLGVVGMGYKGSGPDEHIDEDPNPEGTFGNSVIVESTIVERQCTDSDGGNNRFVKGVTTGVGHLNVQRNDPFDFEDECWGIEGNLLNEYFCKGGLVYWETHIDCEYGCLNGACLESPVKCVDTDPEGDLYVKGYVTIDGGNTKLYDQCGTEQGYYDENLILEAFCDSHRPGITYNVYCPYGCIDGKCINKEPPITQKTLFSTGRGIGNYDKMTYAVYTSEFWFIPKYDMVVTAVEPDIYYCNGECYYTVTLNDGNKEHVTKDLDGVFSDEISLKKSIAYKIYQQVSTTKSVGIYTAGSQKAIQLTNGGYDLISAKSQTADHSDRGAISSKIIGSCPNCGDDVVEQICTDSDNGQNLFVKGTVVDDYNRLTDKCSGSSSVLEGWCEFHSNGSSNLNYFAVNCPDNTKCDDGACVEQTTNGTVTPTNDTCVDSDGGRNYYAVGETFSGGVGNLDYCEGDAIVVESYCDDGKSLTERYECPGGCKDRKCANLVKATKCLISTESGLFCEGFSAVAGEGVTIEVKNFLIEPVEIISGDFQDSLLSCVWVKETILATYETMDIVCEFDEFFAGYQIDADFTINYRGLSNGASEIKTANGELVATVTEEEPEVEVPIVVCGNTICEVGETCLNCNQDCGNCYAICGNGICEEGEALDCDDCSTIVQCDIGEKTYHYCANGAKIPLCECIEDNLWACVDIDDAEDLCPKGECNGCLNDDGKCLPIGTRTDHGYCGLEDEIEVQKFESDSCNNNFECRSNSCVDGQCTQFGFWTKLFGWLERLFG